jgi:hypothetical protein
MEQGRAIGTWNVRSLYRSGSLTAVARELTRYNLHLVGVQEVRWDKRGTVRAGDSIFSLVKGNENHQLGTGFFVNHGIVSEAKRVEFVSDRMSRVVLRGRWCNIIVLTVRAHGEEKSNDSSAASVTTYLPTSHNIREERRPHCRSLSCY